MSLEGKVPGEDVRDWARRMDVGNTLRSRGLRVWFRQHLYLVADAMNDVGWVDTRAEGHQDVEDANIEAVMKHAGSPDTIEAKIRAALAKLTAEEVALLEIKKA